MSAIETIRIRLSTSRAKRTLLVIGIILAVLAAACMVYVILVTPSKQPYRDALAEYKNVYDANITVMVKGSLLNASKATDDQFSKSTEAVSVALTALKAENEALGKKAVLTSGEGKEKYDAFTKKLTSYIAFNTDMLTSMQKVRPVVFACSQSMADISEDENGVVTMRRCSENLEALRSVPNEDYRQLVETSQRLYADFATNLQAKADEKGANGLNSIQSSAVSDEQTHILEALTAAGKTFSTNLQKHKQAVDITDTAMALDRYLSDKSSIFRS